jgi:glutamate N-acetyltransferase/amino-acid N-acetyltransferase
LKVDITKAPGPLRGFRFAGIHGGIKKKGRRDFALVVADKPCVCAAAFTRNKQAAAPVEVAREHSADGRIQAVMINSGNANAATGEQGLELARWACAELAGRLSIAADLVLPCSTGVIGVPLVKRTFGKAIALAVDSLSDRGFGAAARAIMTSDAFPKWAERRIEVDGVPMRVVGMAKGAGMIEPNMATLISVVITDAPLEKKAADSVLSEALAGSYNRITIDGDTSTNDTAVLLASGEVAGQRIADASSPGYAEVAAAVREVMDELSRLMIRDGEGATRMVDIVVEGAPSDALAAAGARTIARSVLFKCALAGADPNWGRIVCGLGNSELDFERGDLTVYFEDVAVVRDGVPVGEEALKLARAVMRREAFVIRVVVGDGPGKATMVTSDLTEAYVHFNSAYTS